MKIETAEEKEELNLITLAQEYTDEDKVRGLRAGIDMVFEGF
jgi:hypothetical protein